MRAKSNGPGFCLWNDEWPLMLAWDDGQQEGTFDEDVVPVDVVARADVVVVTAEVSQLAQEQLDVEVRENEITISGAESAGAAPEDTWLLHERIHRAFQRTVALPVSVDTADVTARLDDGVLTITAHRHVAPQVAHVHLNAPPRA